MEYGMGRQQTICVSFLYFYFEYSKDLQHPQHQNIFPQSTSLNIYYTRYHSNKQNKRSLSEIFIIQDITIPQPSTQQVPDDYMTQVSCLHNIMLKLELYPHLLEQLSLPVLLASPPFVPQVLACGKAITQRETIQHLTLCYVVIHSLAGQELRVIILATVSVLVGHVQGLDLVLAEALRRQKVFVHSGYLDYKINCDKGVIHWLLYSNMYYIQFLYHELINMQKMSVVDSNIFYQMLKQTRGLQMHLGERIMLEQDLFLQRYD